MNCKYFQNFFLIEILGSLKDNFTRMKILLGEKFNQVFLEGFLGENSLEMYKLNIYRMGTAIEHSFKLNDR